MKKLLLLTGAPGAGKTTIIKEALSRVNERAGGFYTREIREQGVRQGFELVTLEGEATVLAHVNAPGGHRVSKYGVRVENLDAVGVTAIRRAIQECDVVVIDEIGKMELFSPSFRDAVRDALMSGKKVLGTIMLKPHPWADEIKRSPEVELITVTRTNHQQVLNSILRWLGANQ